jgi:two-component system, LytTR family, response regulator
MSRSQGARSSAFSVRTNRKQIIALPFVDKVELGIGGRLLVQLRGGPEIEISRRQARTFKTAMGQ